MADPLQVRGIEAVNASSMTLLSGEKGVTDLLANCADMSKACNSVRSAHIGTLNTPGRGP